MAEISWWVWAAALYGAAGVASGAWHLQKLNSDAAFRRNYDELAEPVEGLLWLAPPIVLALFGVTPPALLRWLFAASTFLWWPIAVPTTAMRTLKGRGDVSE